MHNWNPLKTQHHQTRKDYMGSEKTLQARSPSGLVGGYTLSLLSHEKLKIFSTYDKKFISKIDIVVVPRNAKEKKMVISETATLKFIESGYKEIKMC